MRRVAHLVDASPYIFRAFHSLPSSIRDPEGRPANATYGFAGFLLRLFESEKPTHLALCFDGSLTTSFRNEMFPDYKAHREPPPTELEAQVPDCREMAEALGIATFIDDRFEADDLVGSLAEITAVQGFGRVVVSSDKDLCQLVDDRVSFLDFARNARLGPAEVEAKMGVRPEQIPDYLGLAGDSVDNIPGVRGVGPKSAVALLERWGSLEELYADLGEVAELPLRGAASLAARLEAGRESAFLSKRLATIVHDMPLDVAAQSLELSAPDWAALDRLCGRLGFTTLPERVRKQLDRAAKPPTG